MSSRAARAAVITAAAAIPAVAAVLATLRMGARGYAQIASDYPGPATALASALGRSTLVLASTLCIGALVTALLLRPRRGPDRLLVEPFGGMSVVRRAGLVWGLAAALLVPIDAADINGQPVSRFADPRALSLIRAGYLPRAWLVVLACVVTLVVTATLSRGWAATAATLLGTASVAVLAPLLVEHVLVGPNHDFAGDATILGAPAGAAWFGATAYLFVFWRRAAPTAALLRRYLRLAAVGWVLVSASQLVVALVETEGTALPATSTGQLFLVQFAVLALLGGLGLRLRRELRAGAPRRARAVLAAATLLVAVYLGADLAMMRIPSPQYFRPTSVAQNYLGYDVASAPTLGALALHWRLNLLFAVLALTAVCVYLLGVRRLSRRGDRWPVGRSIAWIAGWLLTVVTTSSGVGRYAGASFSVHMVLHMSLNMFVPVLLVLGGPVTLLLRAAPARRPDEPAGVHEWVTAVMNWRLTRSFYHPMHALVSYIDVLLRALLQRPVRPGQPLPLGARGDEPRVPRHRVPVLQPGHRHRPTATPTATHRPARPGAGGDAVPRLLRCRRDDQHRHHRRAVLPLPEHRGTVDHRPRPRPVHRGRHRLGGRRDPAHPGDGGAAGAVGPPGPASGHPPRPAPGRRARRQLRRVQRPARTARTGRRREGRGRRRTPGRDEAARGGS